MTIPASYRLNVLNIGVMIVGCRCGLSGAHMEEKTSSSGDLVAEEALCICLTHAVDLK